tara:strand:+ start:409 stop:726 length:318 start_codon:yes stop_codon:yes gene_type:complete
MNRADTLIRRHHKLFAEDDEPFTGDWAIDYFEKYSDRLDIEHSGETDSDNPALGDDAEDIYSQQMEGETFYWIAASTGGPQGPFAKLDEAIAALGYDPRTFELSL